MISYQLQRHRRTHNIKIKIAPTAEVIVVAPSDCPTRFIDSFVQQHQEWIETALAKVRSQRKAIADPDKIQVFGKTYQKKIVFTAAQQIGIRIVGDEMHVNPVSQTAASIQKTIEQFLKNTAAKYIIPRTHQLADTMGITFHNISLKNQKTRWGSCSSDGNLNFNWRLVHSPPVIIDYVIIHELAHRKEMNHSADFWQIVAQFDPEHLKHRGWLKRQGMALG